MGLTGFTAGSEFVSVEVQTDEEEGQSGCRSVCWTLFWTDVLANHFHEIPVWTMYFFFFFFFSLSIKL